MQVTSVSAISEKTGDENAQLPLFSDDNLIEHNEWIAQGFTVAPFLDWDLYEQLREGMKSIVYDIVRDGRRPRGAPTRRAA